MERLYLLFFGASPISDTQSAFPQVNANGGTIRTILQVIFGIIGAITVFIITFAGFKYVTSRGNPEATAKAKNTIIYAVVGLIVSLISFSIVTFVVGNI